MTSRRFSATLEARGPGAVVLVPFPVKEVFGCGRAPVRGTINGHAFRTTTARYGGTDYLGFDARCGRLQGSRSEIASRSSLSVMTSLGL
jgi:uncharacterized protein DUF1905